MQLEAGSAMYCANAPLPTNAATRSPGDRLLTSAPTACTTPENSEPGVKGRAGLYWYLFWMIRTSGKLTAAALISTTTSPAPAVGSGKVLSRRLLGGPKF